MMDRPVPTRIYHITHIDNLALILSDGGLFSDAEMLQRGAPQLAIGMSSIKERRMELPVKCHPSDMVVEYVPFYFCPRSIMLFIFHKDNAPGLTYHGGQNPIVHLELDLENTIEWATAMGSRWAFTLANAGARYTEFRNDIASLSEVNWPAVDASDFTDSTVKEGKQAEFLVERFVSWSLVERIGVCTEQIREQTLATFADPDLCPPVVVRPQWYF